MKFKNHYFCALNSLNNSFHSLLTAMSCLGVHYCDVETECSSTNPKYRARCEFKLMRLAGVIQTFHAVYLPNPIFH